jgi:hypothetical protein
VAGRRRLHWRCRCGGRWREREPGQLVEGARKSKRGRAWRKGWFNT